MIEVLTVSSMEWLIADSSLEDYPIDFPIDHKSQGVIIQKIRVGCEAAAQTINVSNYWYYGLTRNPKSHPTTNTEFLQDGATYCRLTENARSVVTVEGSSLFEVRPQEVNPQILQPYHIHAVIINQMGVSRRFWQEYYYEVVDLPTWQVVALLNKFQRRGGKS